MQAIDVVTQTDRASASPSREELSRDMFALASYMLRSASMGTFNTIAELDLSLTQIKVLCALEMDGQERSVKALAESMGVSLPAMSRAVDGLFDRGFVTRDEDPADRRMKRVRLTDAGLTVPRAHNEARLSGLNELMGSLADDEAQALQDALVLILERHPEIVAHRPEPPAAQAPNPKEADR
ncbi:MAG TPA: MarR family transcriptional regulator [Solirubrobacteraceae bacterium]|nr:MarR family transcriptional regulator [Solirubrobacteraceae bacterium]